MLVLSILCLPVRCLFGRPAEQQQAEDANAAGAWAQGEAGPRASASRRSAPLPACRPASWPADIKVEWTSQPSSLPGPQRVHHPLCVALAGGGMSAEEAAAFMAARNAEARRAAGAAPAQQPPPAA